jgi:hypothetical protein
MAKESKIVLQRVFLSPCLFDLASVVIFAGICSSTKGLHLSVGCSQCAAPQGERIQAAHLVDKELLHTQQCLPLLLLGLEHPDPEKESFRRHCLQALLALISAAWPRFPTHRMSVLKALSALTQDLPEATVHMERGRGVCSLVRGGGVCSLVRGGGVCSLNCTPAGIGGVQPELYSSS